MSKNNYITKAITKAMTKPLSICPSKNRYCRFYCFEGTICLLEHKGCEYHKPSILTFTPKGEKR